MVIGCSTRESPRVTKKLGVFIFPTANSISIVMNAGYEHMMQANYISKKDTRRFPGATGVTAGGYVGDEGA